MTPEHVTSSVATLRAFYEYRPDGPLQTWRFMSVDHRGVFRGDCEDFVLTALEMICGGKLSALRALAVGDARVVRVTYYSATGKPARHIVGECAGLRFDNSGRALPPDAFQRAEYGDDWRALSTAAVLFQIARPWLAGALIGGGVLAALAWGL